MSSLFVITLGDIVGLIIFALAIILISVVYGLQWLGQYQCKHDDGVNETQACDAICKKCCKNLGFIGAWRDKQ